MTKRVVVGILLAAALLSGCGGASSKALPRISLAPITASASSSASPSASASDSGSASPSASPSASASPSPAAPPATSTNLGLDDNVRSALLAAFVTSKALPASYFSGPDAGTTYYAYLAPTKTYWAIAYFSLNPGASQAAQLRMQDDGGGGLFSHAIGAPWKRVAAAGGGGPYPCPGELDPELLTLWHLTVNQGCELASGRAQRATGDVTFVNEGGSDAPSGSYRGLLDLQEINLALTGDVWLDAETFTNGAAGVNNKPLRMLDINVTKATKTEYSVGSDATSGHVVDGVYDGAFGQRVTADFAKPDVTFLITVVGGDATFIQEVSAITPTAPNTYSEP